MRGRRGARGTDARITPTRYPVRHRDSSRPGQVLAARPRAGPSGPFAAILGDPTTKRIACLLSLATAGAAHAQTRNVVLIVSDDHHHDVLGLHPDVPAVLETPHLDAIAREGAWLRNGFVSTSLCSPSRATILTGRHMHEHRVADDRRSMTEAHGSSQSCCMPRGS